MFEPESLLQEKDVEILLGILKPRNIQNVLEIGTWRGYSAKTWWEDLRPKKLITIDIEKKESLSQPVYENPDIFFLWNRDSNNPETAELIKYMLKGEQLDFLFIDGSHLRGAVEQDWILYRPFVKEGGVIVLHDVVEHRDDLEVWKLWGVLKDTSPYVEIKSVKESSGMGVIFV